MLVNSLTYLLFIPLVYLAFNFTSDRYRWLILLGASYCFYSSFKAPQLVFILVLITITSYFCGLRMGVTKDDKRRTGIFWLGVISCLIVLVLVKYLSYIMHSDSLNFKYPNLYISIGVSYFIFQAISYLADIYLEKQEPELSFGHYSLYLAFFPKLLQGPIERAGDLLPQLKKPYVFDYNAMRSGMLLLTWGLFKKTVIADRLAIYVNSVFNEIHAYSGIPLLLGVYAFAFQIYFDFSGYTDIARGTARLFGINLTENFNSPYSATSIADFWRRWHISFSRWILDYIFKPLQLTWRNSGQAGTAMALIVTFLISGVWHGATWGFVVWGLLHGVYLATSTYYRPYQKKLYKWLGFTNEYLLKAWQVFVTFHLVSFAWIFFRAESLSDAIYVITHIPSSLVDDFKYLINKGLWDGTTLIGILTIRDVLYSILLVVVTSFIGVICKQDTSKSMFHRQWWLRWALYIALVISILNMGVIDEIPFVYRNF